MASASARAQAPLRLEISADDSIRDRLLGQLVDLDLEVSELRRPNATVSELEQGEAELCIYVRADIAVVVGLIDRREGGSVQRTELPDANSVSIETAALQVREWAQEILREDAAAARETAELEVEPSPIETTPSPAPEPSQPPRAAALSVTLSAGWHLLAVGADRPFQGGWLNAGVGQNYGRWAWHTGIHGAFSTAQRWQEDDVTIENTRCRASLWGSISRHWSAFELDGRVQLGLLSNARKTLDPGAGRFATPGSRNRSAYVAASLGVAIRLFAGIGAVLRLGTELALDRPVFQAEEGPRFSTWQVRPLLEAGLRVRWPNSTESTSPL